MSNEVDESFKQMKEECDGRLGKMASKRCTGGEFMQFVKIAEVPRILHRMRHSDTGKESIDKIQTMYNRTYRLKGRIVRSMPNEVMWSSKERCGMAWVNFWDEISIDRIVAWMKHANSGGVVGKIAAAAIKRSQEIAPSTTATLEQEEWTTWDGTMMGRIVEWMTGDIGRDFSITGGKINRGKRENDVAISEVNCDRRWAPMIAAGCRVTGIHWISETLTDDGNTWVSELQHNGKFSNNGYFTWKHSTHDAKTAERKTVKKRTKWSEWTKHVKRVTKQAIEEKEEENEQMEKEKTSDDGGSEDESEEQGGEEVDRCSGTLGQYWKDSQPELKPMDVVRVRGTDGEIKMVISQQNNQVKVVRMANCTDMNDGAEHGVCSKKGYIMEFDDTGWNNENGKNLGIHNTVTTNEVVYTVTDGKIETWDREELTKMASEMMKVTVLGRNEARQAGRRREIGVSEIHEKGHGNRGSAFGRIWESRTYPEVSTIAENSIIAGGEKEEEITQYLPICGEGNDCPATERLNESVKKTKERMGTRHKQWRKQAEEIGQNASILAGGDGSRKQRNGETIAAYGWGVYGIGEHSIEYWKNKQHSDVRIMASGGNMDWAPEYARSNTRAEQIHILAAMIQLFETGINVLYSVDYTGAINNFNECEKWTQTEWMTCENKDVMEGIMYMKAKYKNAKKKFECFHNRGHPETYIPEKDPKQYNALERVAVLSDEIADGVRDNGKEWKGTPYIPGRSRFRMMYKGEEIIKPLRKTMKKLAQEIHNRKYCGETRHGRLEKAADETHWGIVGQCNRRRSDGGRPYDKARQTYHWLMTKHALVKKGIVENKNGNANCTCGKIETQWHTMSSCTKNGLPALRRRFAKRRKKMMDTLKIPARIQICIIDNLEPGKEGQYPDWSATSAGKYKYTFKHREEKIVAQMEKHRGAAVHWFQNGHPMKTMIERHDEMLGVDERTAHKFCKEWYLSKRRETAAIWKQRTHKLDNEKEFSISELKEQVKEIVTRKRNMKPPETTLANNEYNKLQREGLEQLIEMEKNRFDQQSMLRWTMGGANDNRKSRAEAEEQLTEAEEKRVTLRKRQKEMQERKYHGQKATTKRIDSIFARIEK
jgi:hypothetical protein